MPTGAGTEVFGNGTYTYTGTTTVNAGVLKLSTALALQCGRPVHECFYAACAEAAFAPLVSSDETFLQALRCEGIAVRGIPLARVTISPISM